MDETDLSTIPNKSPKVLTNKGKKLVGKVTSGERGQLVTAFCCVNFKTAYARIANIEKAQNSFRRAGIFSYDPEQFGDEGFAPSLVTDICLEGFTDNVLEVTSGEEPAHPGYVEDTSKRGNIKLCTFVDQAYESKNVMKIKFVA
ncbi:hypothetical protein ILUMI_13171 [Ignelater luminosus]|uniref:Uncharacterized protein n=1 Tax=Ignelater luminosus TaxID=2038154 RepID=A0A8K0G627_IGNLU|nr:hypothetical protein ILUMI_13171 [Ignelater luminosus]